MSCRCEQTSNTVWQITCKLLQIHNRISWKASKKLLPRIVKNKRPFLAAFGNLKYFSSSNETNKKLIVDDLGDKGVITLNRPKYLNAVDNEMVIELFSVLSKWRSNKNLVLIKGADKKAFCAGGDLKLNLTMNNLHQYFHTFHKTILLIQSYPVPFVPLMDGLVMGGGAGLSVFGSLRVATENTIFAMPETKIAFIPNVGSPYFLQQLDGKLGLYLGLTSNRLEGTDVVKAGVATHYCKSCDIPDLENALLETTTTNDARKVLESFSEKNIPELSFSAVKDKMDHCFSQTTVEEIIFNLEKDDSKWASDTLTVLKRFSPTSLKVTLKEFQLAKEMSLKECLAMEYRLNINFLCHNRDTFKAITAFREGKMQPNWEPPTLAEVSEEYVDSFFARCSTEEPL